MPPTFPRYRLPLLLAAAGCFGAAPAAFAAGINDGGDWGLMIMGLCGGLALFLLGLDRMTDGLRAATGARLQKILESFTTNRVSGVLTGALITAVIQSSSVTTVLVVGFVSAGVMSLGQSIGVIMGANIGSTVTAQIVAFQITELALALIAGGFALTFSRRREHLRQYGSILLGLGLVFYGMTVMSNAMLPLRTYDPFISLMTRMDHPLFGLLTGLVFTALVQSSAVTTSIVVALAAQGFISLPAGIALALGADIGTCITALLAAVGKPRIAARVAAAHLIFNLAGVMLWLGFIDQLAHISTWLSPAHPHLQGMARAAADTPRQIANANTLFKVFNTLLFIWITPQFARFTTWLLPSRPSALEPQQLRPRYLDEELLETPSMALGMARREVGRLGEHVLLMMVQLRQGLEQRDSRLFKELERLDDGADQLHGAIMEYLNQVGKRSLTEEEAADFFQLGHAADTLENIGDILANDLAGLGDKLARRQQAPSDTTRILLSTLHEEVYLALESAIRAVALNDRQAAQEVLILKAAVDQTMEAAFHRQSQSLALSDRDRLALLRVEFELTDKFKRIYSLCKRMARLLLPPTAPS